MYPGTRVAAAILSLGLAAAPAAALTVDEARHILLRTGFGATPAEIAPLLSLNRQAAVDALIASAAHASLLPRPQWYGTYQAPPRPNPKDTVASQAAQAAYDAMMHQRSLDIVTWWYRQMMSTSSPLLERMVLFWHGHFTSSIQKVNVPDLMLRQNLLLRQDALGNFRQLVHDIARDPAMLLYLDGGGNVKGHPNENFARELMELFTLGEGHYTEEDVREAARAFTGWRVDGQTGAAAFDPQRHDDGLKTFLGATGNWDGDDIIDIILAQPEAARFIVQELWQELISPAPDPQTVAVLAERFRAGGYEIAPLLRDLLSSSAFWDPRVRGTLVKSPVVLAVDTARVLGLDPGSAEQVAAAVRPMGEQIFDPPTVKGWPSGDGWITSSTLLARESALRRLPAAVVASAARSLDTAASAMATLAGLAPQVRMDTLLLPVIPLAASAAAASQTMGSTAPVTIADVLRLALQNPLYQLM